MSCGFHLKSMLFSFADLTFCSLIYIGRNVDLFGLGDVLVDTSAGRVTYAQAMDTGSDANFEVLDLDLDNAEHKGRCFLSLEVLCVPSGELPLSTRATLDVGVVSSRALHSTPPSGSNAA